MNSKILKPPAYMAYFGWYLYGLGFLTTALIMTHHYLALVFVSIVWVISMSVLPSLASEEDVLQSAIFFSPFWFVQHAIAISAIVLLTADFPILLRAFCFALNLFFLCVIQLGHWYAMRKLPEDILWVMGLLKKI